MTGWIRPSLLLASALLVNAPAPAAEDGDTPAPEEAFLLFLGEWQDDEGNWQDPMAYAQAEAVTSEETSDDD